MEIGELYWSSIDRKRAVWLERPFEMELIRFVVFQGVKEKSSGPNGFSVLPRRLGYLNDHIMKVSKEHHLGLVLIIAVLFNLVSDGLSRISQKKCTLWSGERF